MNDREYVQYLKNCTMQYIHCWWHHSWWHHSWPSPWFNPAQLNGCWWGLTCGHGVRHSETCNSNQHSVGSNLSLVSVLNSSGFMLWQDSVKLRCSSAHLQYRYSVGQVVCFDERCDCCSGYFQWRGCLSTRQGALHYIYVPQGWSGVVSEQTAGVGHQRPAFVQYWLFSWSCIEQNSSFWEHWFCMSYGWEPFRPSTEHLPEHAGCRHSPRCFESTFKDSLTTGRASALHWIFRLT